MTNFVVCLIYTAVGTVLLASYIGRQEKLKHDQDEMFGYAELGDGEDGDEAQVGTNEAGASHAQRGLGGFRGRRRIQRTRLQSVKRKVRQMKIKMEKNKLFVLAIGLCVGL